MIPHPQVSCIVLNWNGWRDTVECLNALKKSTYPQTVIVVDNGSTNDSVARIRASHPDILLIESEKNLGFAGGNNIGIRHALTHGADFVWLLNNDTQPAPNALSALVAKALIDPKVGAVASICYYASSPSLVEAWAGARVNLWIGYGRNSTRPRSDEWFDSLNGTSVLVSRMALEDAGLFDEEFFLYWEDTEFCFRLRKKGWRLAAAPDSQVLHKVNASTGGNKLALDRYQTTSGLRLLRLHSPAPYLASLAFLLIRFVRRLARLQFDRCRSVWAGVQDYRQMLPISPKIR
ncbi:MAG TPA: glycosyltransferase family 2 protein [Terriglobales bacterium]|nr:glycosyltransferase family 2 protein [Terriglobales bacterium]